ncbi:hypothetical protein QUC31_015473 [Theobroma cacao]
MSVVFQHVWREVRFLFTCFFKRFYFVFLLSAGMGISHNFPGTEPTFPFLSFFVHLCIYFVVCQNFLKEYLSANLWNINCVSLLFPVKTIYARTANDQVTTLESALMWQFVTIVISLGTLLQNARPSLYAGIVVNLATQLAIVQMRESATPVGRLDIGPETAQHPQCHLGM